MKQLKVGQRIRLEGVVVNDNHVRLNGSDVPTYLRLSELNQCEIIEDLKDYYVSEDQKWEPKVGEEAMYNDTLINIHAVHEYFVWGSWKKSPELPFTIKLSEVRPIAKPVMKEPRELYSKILESVGHASVCWDENKVFDEKEATKCADSLLEFFLAWHNRHTTPDLEVTDEKIYKKAQELFNRKGTHPLNDIIDGIRHFLNLQKSKGGKG